jgi:UDP-glucose 4-epimerase
MRILVIGGAGFLGSHLVERLLAENHSVDVVDDLSSGSLANLATARQVSGDLKFHHLDACSDDLLSLVSMREPAVVVHLAGLVPGRCTPAGLGRAVHSTANVLEAARMHGVGRVVTAIPGAAFYGEVPARELPVKEGRTPTDRGPVGVVAQAMVDLMAVYRSQHAIEFTALALGAVYGPRQRPDGGVVAAFADALLSDTSPTIHGDGRQRRDFVYIDDAVDALARAIHRGSGLVINVGTGVATSVGDVWTMLAGAGSAGAAVAAVAAATVTGDPARVGVARNALSGTRARIHLAWAPWTSLDEGITQLRRQLGLDAGPAERTS